MALYYKASPSIPVFYRALPKKNRLFQVEFASHFVGAKETSKVKAQLLRFLCSAGLLNPYTPTSASTPQNPESQPPKPLNPNLQRELICAC